MHGKRQTKYSEKYGLGRVVQGPNGYYAWSEFNEKAEHLILIVHRKILIVYRKARVQINKRKRYEIRPLGELLPLQL